MSRLKKTLAIGVFAGIIYGLKYWLGFESMIMAVIISWFSTMLDENK